ncbi:NERD domain-containing protein [Bacillus sp. ISL-41]|uniref:nuclease-related domain-containing protein n=1 Tax=Bacillus sp. ISL-41 TaxID=2819127 RepID=UPI001BE86A62|nr:nuclease-related domain-containing protein [Bacillus sp. ISL-41]MBT2644337.1 NERD domain-containing protein [Bacillus sp. ISL-41]
MILKSRQESDELKIMNLLEPRMIFTEKERQRHYSLRKGYEGEVQYDAWMKGLEIEHLTLNDLLLEMGGSVFQIDSTVILQDTIYFNDVKYYEGDYYYEGEHLKKVNGNEVKDPLIQLKRGSSLFRQLLISLGFKLPIKALLIFNNPEFALYQAPRDAPIILPNQLNRFLKNLNSKHSKLTNLHHTIAEKLISLHITKSPYQRMPSYEYEQLQKGIICPACNSFMDAGIAPKKYINCGCGAHEEIEIAIMGSFRELNLLFPDRRLTTNLIYEWCNGVIPKRTIRRILNKNLELTGHAQWSYYE